MTTPFPEIGRFLRVLCLAACALATLTSAQTRPNVAVQWSAGRPTLSLTGDLGTVYSIQVGSDLSQANPWTDRALIQVKTATAVWADPDPQDPVAGHRFYRVVSVAAPADTNLVFIEPGTFTMGSPTNEASRCSNEIQHLVTISRGFWMNKFLVTQADYLALVGSNPSYFRPPFFTLDLTRPVENLTWGDATNYCAIRTQQEQAAGRIPTNCVYRLPTESEWEYACRAGTTTAFYLGNVLRSGDACFNGMYEYDAAVGQTLNPSGISPHTTSPVGSYPPNPWGLYDMIGNVKQWCQEFDGPYPVGPVVDPQGSTSGGWRAYRGGYWCAPGYLARSAQRLATPQFFSSLIGFRVVLVQNN